MALSYANSHSASGGKAFGDDRQMEVGTGLSFKHRTNPLAETVDPCTHDVLSAAIQGQLQMNI